MLVSILTGFLIGLLATALTNREGRMGCWGNIFIGWLGSWLGTFLLGDWGPKLWGTALIPAVLGASILLLLFVKKDQW